MTFRVPRREEMILWLVQETRDRIPAANMDVGEPYQVFSEIYGTGQWSTVPPMQFAAQQILPDTASTDFVPRHGRWRRLPQRPAAAAKGLVLMDGKVGTPIPSGLLISDKSGHDYTTTSAQIVRIPSWLPIDIIAADPSYPDRFVVRTAIGMAVGDAILIGGSRYAIRELPGGGAVIVYGLIPLNNMVGLVVTATTGAVVSVTASAVGDDYNRRPGDRLQLESAPTDIAITAQTLRISDGAQIETQKDWVGRMQLRDTEHPAGGNRSQIVLWMLGFASKLERDLGLTRDYALGVARGYVYPLMRGRGTADMLPQGAAKARHLSPAKLRQVQEYINPEPTDAINIGMVGMGADIIAKDHVDLPVDVYVRIYGAPGFLPDWRGLFGAITGGTESRILVGSSPVGVIVPGNRIAVFVDGRLEVRQVVMVDAAGLSVDPPLPEAVPAGETIYPGSSLIEPVRDSLSTLFDKIGPGDTWPKPSRYPRPTSDEPAELRLPNIDRFVMSVQGMRTCAILRPAADVIPPAQVQIVPRKLIIEHMP